MPKYVVNKLLKAIKDKNISVKKSKVLILGLTFKENCNDLRNSQVINLYKLLKEKTEEVDVFDPMVETKDAYNAYKIDLISKPKNNFYDVIIIAVPHDIFREMGGNKIKKFGKKISIIYDIKYLLPPRDSDLRLWKIKF